ncbi:MAG: OmpA family protein [Bacteroides sp.]|nr:OmpA family protein [Bacteroides sp.]
MKNLLKIFPVLALSLLPCAEGFAQGSLSRTEKYGRVPKPKSTFRKSGDKEYNTAQNYINKGNFYAAYEYLLDASKAGNDDACKDCGTFCLYGIEPVKQNYEEAYDYSRGRRRRLLADVKELVEDESIILGMFNSEDKYYTIYYAIGQTDIAPDDYLILYYIAEKIKRTPGSRWRITGWDDNYTGTAEESNRIRNKRASAVADYLIQKGVAPKQLSVGIDSGNLTDLGVQGAPFDRAVTICEEY